METYILTTAVLPGLPVFKRRVKKKWRKQEHSRITTSKLNHPCKSCLVPDADFGENNCKIRSQTKRVTTPVLKHLGGFCGTKVKCKG